MKKYDESLFKVVQEKQRYAKYYITINEKGIMHCAPKLQEYFQQKNVVVKYHENALLVKTAEEQVEDAMVIKKSGNNVETFAQELVGKKYILPVRYQGSAPEEGIWYGETDIPPAPKRTKKNCSQSKNKN